MAALPSTTGPEAPAGRGPQRARRAFAVPVAAVVLVVVLVLATCVGPVGIGVGTVVRTVLSHLPGLSSRVAPDQVQDAIVWQLRVPRVLLAALVGAVLSAAGASYQAVLRNPLADPYLLGVAAGAGLGATAAIVAGGGTVLLPAAAFAGAVLAVVLTYLVAAGGSARLRGQSVVLAGVAVAATLTAAQTYLQQQHSDEIRQIYNWLLGSMSAASWADVRLVLPYALLSCGVLFAYRRTMDVLRVGTDEAATLGVHPTRTRLIVIGAATLGTAAAVSVSGLVGFVGVIVPHAVRLLVSSSYRLLLPVSMLAGAAFLVLADLAARTLAAPSELPIGVVTAVIGAPCFLLLLRSRRGSGGAL